MFSAIFRTNFKLASEILLKVPEYERFNEKLIKIYYNFSRIALKAVFVIFQITNCVP